MGRNIQIELTTDRLQLRGPSENDWEIIFCLRTDPNIIKYIERPPSRIPKQKTDVIQFIDTINAGIANGDWTYWGITLPPSDNLIGTICLWNFSTNGLTAEVGFDLLPGYQGQGIMTEALRAVIKYGFDKLQLLKIEAFTHFQNEASFKLLSKTGFELNSHRKDETNEHNIILELSKDQFNFVLE